jgi:hypothetical protein
VIFESKCKKRTALTLIDPTYLFILLLIILGYEMVRLIGGFAAKSKLAIAGMDAVGLA